MKPSKHVQKNPDTGKFCVYNLKGKKVAEFDSEDKAVAYATKNHDSLYPIYGPQYMYGVPPKQNADCLHPVLDCGTENPVSWIQQSHFT